MRRVRVKICGITRLQDALEAIEQGADALGFVFYRPSPRYIEPAEAQKIIAQLPAFVSMVGLFMDADRLFVQDALDSANLDLLQFHGRETPGFCRSFDRPYIKAVPMREALDIPAYCASFADSLGVLLDSTKFGAAGGSGERFDWNTIPELKQSVIMAGGIHVDNVLQAIRLSGCYAVDVSSGVEVAPGKKDAYKMQKLFNVVQALQA